MAQGIEIDYVTQGHSLPEVKQLFQDGLKATINEHLKRFQTIEHLLAYAPEEILVEFDEMTERPLFYSHVSIHVNPKTDARFHFFAAEDSIAA